MTDSPQLVQLKQLVANFHETLSSLGQFRQVATQDVPPPYDRLLVHQYHMTVTVEEYFGSLVDLEVVQQMLANDTYAREILLKLQDGREVVQYGIVQLAGHLLPFDVRAEIEQQGAPLGRILIRHDVMRQLELTATWQIEPAAYLSKLMQLAVPTPTYGRSAVIHVDGSPAIRVLEIVKPVG